MTDEPEVGRDIALDTLAVPLYLHFNAILDEFRSAIRVAERERAKAAEAATHALERAIDDGDRNLQDHIKSQIAQVASALVASDRAVQQQYATLQARLDGMAELSNERLTALVARITTADTASILRISAMQRETGLIQEASQEAIKKAEASAEKRFASVNEFRAQLASQAASFMPREVADAQFVEIRRAIAELADKVNRIA